METKKILMVNVVLFCIVAILHLWRAFAGLELNIGTFSLPVWASFLASLVLFSLAYLNFKAK